MPVTFETKVKVIMSRAFVAKTMNTLFEYMISLQVTIEVLVSYDRYKRKKLTHIKQSSHCT